MALKCKELPIWEGMRHKRTSVKKRVIRRENPQCTTVTRLEGVTTHRSSGWKRYAIILRVDHGLLWHRECPI